MIYSGSMLFNPITDELFDAAGKPFKFAPPTGFALPGAGFEKGNLMYTPTQAAPARDMEIIVSPTSDRLAILEPFPAFEKKEMKAKVIVKVAGKCTTDHISAAGIWLKYKGHLENISYNTLIGAVNAENGEVNKAYDEDGSSMGIPQLMMSMIILKAFGANYRMERKAALDYCG